METTAKFSVSVIGEETGTSFTGDFVVKTLMTRRDSFTADERKRLIIGNVSNPAMVPSNIHGEAYMLSQLSVRVVNGPDWWIRSDSGMDLADSNIIGEIFRLALEKEDERKAALGKTAEKALEKLSKKAKGTQPTDEQA